MDGGSQAIAASILEACHVSSAIQHEGRSIEMKGYPLRRNSGNGRVLESFVTAVWLQLGVVAGGRDGRRWRGTALRARDLGVFPAMTPHRCCKCTSRLQHRMLVDRMLEIYLQYLNLALQ